MGRPRKPFMIERNPNRDLPDGDDYAKIRKDGSFQKWVDWEGSQFATEEEAQAIIDANPILKDEGCKVVEILEYVRATV